MKSKRFEELEKRPVNQDGFVDEWVEEGLIAMQSPNDPKPSIKIVNGEVVELDGKEKADFDLIDSYIASGEWEGKAGAYGIQGTADCFVDHVNGDIDNVIGLPLQRVMNIFKEKDVLL